jgi:patatin-like phospholipase/acyl hydrolase
MGAYRILSIDGGGVRGLLAAVLLQQLDQRVPGWRDRLNLIAGTSTGGIIALGLANGLEPSDLRDLYVKETPRIFRDTFWDDVRDLGRVIGAEYGIDNLRRALDEVFQDTLLEDLNTRVLVPVFDLDDGNIDPQLRSWKPKLFHNFPGPDCDGHRRAADIALYTSAAPTFFPSVDGYVDGGVAIVNPAMAALAQTQDLRCEIADRPEIDEVVLLSIGTGRVLSRIEGDRHNWGYVQWVRPLIRLMSDAVSGIPDYQAGQILGEKYHRLDYTFRPDEGVAMDEWQANSRLVHIAEHQMNHELDRAAEWLRALWM